MKPLMSLQVRTVMTCHFTVLRLTHTLRFTQKSKQDDWAGGAGGGGSLGWGGDGLDNF